MTALSAEEIEAERPRFEEFARKCMLPLLRALTSSQGHRNSKHYASSETEFAWQTWTAAKADALAQQPPSEPSRKTLSQPLGEAHNHNLSEERRKAHQRGYLEGMSASTARNLVALLRRSMKQLDAWQSAYGEHQPAWLPPVGDVRWAGDVDEALTEHAVTQPHPVVQGTLQERVQPWMMACFGPAISADVTERNHRFLEESLELVQSTGCTQSEAHQLVDYVFGRPAGEPAQEIGGVMITLAALCLAIGADMDQCGETELARIWTCVEKIRDKQAAKPPHSPLPVPSALPERQSTITDEVLRTEFECQHKGRNLKQHYLRGTYNAPPIAALWNQHVRTARWLEAHYFPQVEVTLLNRGELDVLWGVAPSISHWDWANDVERALIKKNFPNSKVIP